MNKNDNPMIIPTIVDKLAALRADAKDVLDLTTQIGKADSIKEDIKKLDDIANDIGFKLELNEYVQAILDAWEAEYQSKKKRRETLDKLAGQILNPAVKPPKPLN